MCFATGFSETAGLAFDPFSGDLFISDQASRTIWRLSFAPPTQVPARAALLLFGMGLMLLRRQRRD